MPPPEPTATTVRHVSSSPEGARIKAVRPVAGSRTVVVAEQEPRIRKTRWEFAGHARDVLLSFPRLLFPIVFWRGDWEKTFIFVLEEAWSGPDTKLCGVPLPNICSDHRVCVGSGAEIDTLVRSARQVAGWEAKTEAVLQHFWSTHFNDHLSGRLRAEMPAVHPALASIAAWERASRQDPAFISRCAWPCSGRFCDICFDD